MNSGEVVDGTIGGGGRVEVTVIGDVVNTAAWVERDTVPLKGKRERVRLWALERPEKREGGAHPAHRPRKSGGRAGGGTSAGTPV